MAPRLAGTAAALAVAAVCARSHAKVEVSFQGNVETHFRFSLPGKASFRLPDRVLKDDGGELRFNENRFFLQTDVDLTPKVSARAAVRTVFYGFSNLPQLEALAPSQQARMGPQLHDLTQRAQIDPFWWEMDAAYIELRDLGVEGLDIRIGRQIVHWGTADQFNPTNNVNPYDFRDPLTFGQSMANNMVKIDYAAGKGVTFTGIWVPVFRSAQLPVFGLLALGDPNAFDRRYAGDPRAVELFQLASQLGVGFDRVNAELVPRTPDLSLRNSMAAAKVAFKVLGSDLSLSYFRGAFNLPRPQKVEVRGTPQNGLIPIRVELGYPAMHVVGGDFTTSIAALGGLGLWVEGAVVFHDDLRTELTGLGPLDRTLTEQKGGAFWKLTAGVDYTFGKHVYTNLQYLHGFIDEFGDRFINDYVVGGFDFKNTKDTITFRLFGVLNLQDKSHVWYPAILLRPWGGAEFTVGAFLYGGTRGTKFGGLESGSNLFFVRGRVSF